jgi:hypothetical protein
MLHIWPPTPTQSKKGGGIPCFNKKHISNEGDHDHKTNNNHGENTLKTTMMMTTTM